MQASEELASNPVDADFFGRFMFGAGNSRVVLTFHCNDTLRLFYRCMQCSSPLQVQG